MSVISFKGVTFGYTKRTVLNRVTCKIEQGDFIGIIGPNGSGKTTFLKLLLGLLTSQRGSIALFNHPIEDFEDWHRIGYVPQRKPARPLFPATVREIVALGRSAKHGMFTRLQKADERAIDEAIKTVGLKKVTHEKMGNLSGGQLQRVFIARALAADPDLLILDEPTLALDIAAERSLFALLKRLHKQGKTLVVVSHNMPQITKHATKLLCIETTVKLCPPTQKEWEALFHVH